MSEEIEVETIARKTDLVTYCKPSYGPLVARIDVDEYEIVEDIEYELGEPDQKFPKCAAFKDQYKLGSTIIKKK